MRLFHSGCSTASIRQRVFNRVIGSVIGSEIGSENAASGLADFSYAS